MKAFVLAALTANVWLGASACAQQIPQNPGGNSSPQVRLERMSESGIALVVTSRETWTCGSETLVVDRSAAKPRHLTISIDGATAPTKAIDDLMRDFNERDVIRVDVFACPFRQGDPFTVEIFQFSYQGKNISLGRFKVQKSTEAMLIPYEERHN